mmetsp:Transcript_23039/g.22418  ORF Transcript_23039/g.22418 Transcript_23039/m.22418 type:complete len:114 (+) Transcript_23039:588-929(+)
MLNMNLTYAMALTVKSILDRVQESQDLAKKQTKLYNQQMGNKVEEEEEEKHQKQRKTTTAFRNTSLGMLKKGDGDVLGGGYLFCNYTGLPVRFSLHDQELVIGQESDKKSAAS